MGLEAEWVSLPIENKVQFEFSPSMADPGQVSDGGGNDERQTDNTTQSHRDMFRGDVDYDWNRRRSLRR